MNKLLASSVDPNKVGLTVKGLAILVVVYLFRQSGIEVDQVEAVQFVEIALTVIGGLATLYGLWRKTINR